MPLEGIDNIHGGDSLPLGVFGVGDSIPDDVLKENLEDSTGLLIDETRDTLDSSTASQTPDGGLGDSLDVVSQHLTVTLGASLSESLASFATSSHVAAVSVTDDWTLNRCCLYRVFGPMMGRYPAIGCKGDTIKGARKVSNKHLQIEFKTDDTCSHFVIGNIFNVSPFIHTLFDSSK